MFYKNQYKLISPTFYEMKPHPEKRAENPTKTLMPCHRVADQILIQFNHDLNLIAGLHFGFKIFTSVTTTPPPVYRMC